MSGGHFDYIEDKAVNAMFGYDVYIPRYFDGEYAKEYKKNLAAAIRMDPMEDADVSALLFDMLYLIHSCDFYKSGDTGPDDYRKDLDRFRAKWFGTSRDERLLEYVDIIVGEARDRCRRMIEGKLPDEE